MEKVKFGIIGAGMIAQIHIRALKSMKGVQVIAIADPYGENLKEAAALLPSSPKMFGDYRELLREKDIQAVVVAVPNYLHARVTLDALKKDKDVLCEKPMAIDLKDCDMMIEEAGKRSRILQIGQVMRFSSLFEKAVELINREKIIGKLKLAFFHQFRSPYLKKVDDWILDPKRSGGTLVEINCHYFDLANWISESTPAWVAATGGSDIVYSGKEPLDNSWVIVEYKNGIRACFGLAMFSSSSLKGPTMGLLGEKGNMEIYLGEGRLTCHLPQGKKISHSINPEEDQFSSLFFREEKSFVQAIKTRGKPQVDGEIGRQGVLLGLLSERALREKRCLKV